jgi:membrane-associated phospholipid phosphatase
MQFKQNKTQLIRCLLESVHGDKTLQPDASGFSHTFAVSSDSMTIKVLAISMLLASTVSPCLCAQTPQPQPDRNPNDAPCTTQRQQSQADSDRAVSWKKILPNVAEDQRDIWLFPTKVAKERNWIPVATVLGATAGLIALDPIDAHYFRSTSTYRGFNQVFTSNATLIGTIVAPVSLYGIGLIRRDSKMQKTALLAGEAVADAEIVTTVLKDVDKRLRPVAVPARGNLWDTWFESPGSALRGNGSFPSGHSIAAFAIATVVARRYRQHRWVPYAAYGLATLVGFSRVSLSEHFVSDVFVGGVLGYSISRFAVLRQ